MDDVSQSQLGKEIDEFMHAAEFVTNKKIREIEFLRCVNLTTIINDGRYLHENPRLLEGPLVNLNLKK